MDKIITRRYEVRLRDGTVGTIETDDETGTHVGDYVTLEFPSETKKRNLVHGHIEEIIDSAEIRCVDAVYVATYSGYEEDDILKVFECENAAIEYAKDCEKKYGDGHWLPSYGVEKVEFVRDKNRKMNFIEAIEYLKMNKGRDLETCRKVKHVNHPDGVFLANYNGGLRIYTEYGSEYYWFIPTLQEVLEEWEVYHD